MEGTARFDYSNLIGKMASKGITRRDLAPKIGMNISYFGQLLSAGKPMSSDKILRSAQILEIPMTDIGAYFFTLKY